MKKHRQLGLPFFRVVVAKQREDRAATSDAIMKKMYTSLNADAIVNQEYVVNDAISRFRRMDYEETLLQ